MQEELLDDSTIQLPIDLYPSLWRRFLAAFADVFVLAIGLSFLNLLLVLLEWEKGFFYPFLLIIPLYKWWVEAQLGATIGKRIQGIVIVDFKKQEPISYGQSFRRNSGLLLYFLLLIGLLHLQDITGFNTHNYDRERIVWVFRLSEFLFLYFVVLGVGFLFLFFSSNKRTLYDYLTGTVCMEVTASEKPD